ncbi:hypothetical protein [Methylobacterium bullatum]|uniref:hypothetical protein n=1 Tax=Methylobacterium bullatum TaxID=570505 RepID=UPI0017809928|nr:hypothetical protein [Methylobacterium bullatum]
MTVALVGRQQPMRRMYVTPKFESWCHNDLGAIPSTHWGGDIPVKDQVKDLLQQYISGQPLDFSRQFNVLSPGSYGVWELKTGDVRIFGWFVHFDCYIANVGGDANFIKEDPNRRYASLIDETRNDREELGLDEPSFIDSVDPKDVISF